MPAAIGPPVVIAPASSQAETFSFVGDVPEDPVVRRNETQLQILEETLRGAERHARAAEDRALESEEHLMRLTLSFNAREANREAEAAEYERRLVSEQTAKHNKGLEIERLASQTADLHARMLIQSHQSDHMAEVVTALRLQISFVPALPPQTATATPDYHEDYFRQSLMLQRNQQIIDQLTNTLERTQEALATVLQNQAAASSPPSVPAVPPLTATAKTWS